MTTGALYVAMKSKMANADWESPFEDLDANRSDNFITKFFANLAHTPLCYTISLLLFLLSWIVNPRRLSCY